MMMDGMTRKSDTQTICLFKNTNITKIRHKRLRTHKKYKYNNIKLKVITTHNLPSLMPPSRSRKKPSSDCNKNRSQTNCPSSCVWVDAKKVTPYCRKRPSSRKRKAPSSRKRKASSSDREEGSDRNKRTQRKQTEGRARTTTTATTATTTTTATTSRKRRSPPSSVSTERQKRRTSTGTGFQRVRKRRSRSPSSPTSSSERKRR